ncbi:MAG: LysR substrate-binding domain-containing protein [Singulisphaera sp.]
MALTLEPGPGLIGDAVCSERAYEIDYLTLVPTSHPLARKTTMRRDLVAHPLIVGHPETSGRRLLEQALHQEGLDRLQIAVEIDNARSPRPRPRRDGCRRDGRAARGCCPRVGCPIAASTLGRARIVFLWKRGSS